MYVPHGDAVTKFAAHVTYYDIMLLINNRFCQMRWIYGVRSVRGGIREREKERERTTRGTRGCLFAMG